MGARLSFSVIIGVALLVGACGGGSGGCPTGSEAQQQRGAQIVASRCVVCHSSKLVGAARAGAPEGYNFDDLSVVKTRAGEMLKDVGSGRMPKTGALTQAEVDDLSVYLGCVEEP